MVFSFLLVNPARLRRGGCCAVHLSSHPRSRRCSATRQAGEQYRRGGAARGGGGGGGRGAPRRGAGGGGSARGRGEGPRGRAGGETHSLSWGTGRPRLAR